MKTFNYGNIKFAVGQFILKEDEEGNTTLSLIDSENRAFPIKNVAIISNLNGDENTNATFPKPYIINKDGEITTEGAKVLIIFPKGNSFPVVLGCLNYIGMQIYQNPQARIDLNNLADIKSFIRHGDCLIQKTENRKGYSLLINNGSYVINADYITLISSEGLTIDGGEGLNLRGSIIDISGKDYRLSEFTNEQINENKADEINLFANKINLGYSPDISGVDLNLDSSDEVESPLYQNSVMGITLKTLLEKFIDIMKNSTFMGNGVAVKMSVQDQQRLENEVKSKLNKILSKVVLLLARKDIIK